MDRGMGRAAFVAILLLIAGVLNIVYGIGAIGSLLAVGGPYPYWSLAIFALCVICIHGLVVYGEDEWPGKQPEGQIAPYLVDLVDRGLIRVLDLVFLAKGEDGSIAALEIADVGGEVAELAIFEGASSGLLSEEDHEQAGAALEPGTSAALLVYENAWAGPFAAAVRRSGGELVASGRIPAADILAALDAVEATA